MKKLIKNTLKCLIIILVSVSVIGCGNSKDKAQKDELVMGLDDTFAPMGFKDSKGNLVGFDVDLANEVSKRINKKIKFQPIDWSMKETELNAGNIDLIWNGYSITDERKEKVIFSDPYIENSQLIVVLKDSKIKTKNDLANKSIATQKDSSTETAFKDDKTGIVDKFKGGKATLYATFTDVFSDLDTKRSDAIVGDAVLVRYIIKQKNNDNYRILEENFGNEQMGVGMRKDDTELQTQINKAFSDMKDDGTYQTIFDKWFD